jgi:hypothetical protein
MRARSVIFAALGCAFMLGAAAPAFADDHRRDDRDRHYDRDRHDWHRDRGYYAPPVVVGPPVGYYSPPPVYANPGLSIGVNIR